MIFYLVMLTVAKKFHPAGLQAAILPVTTKVYLSSTKTHTGIKNNYKIVDYIKLTMTFLNQFENTITI